MPASGIKGLVHEYLTENRPTSIDEVELEELLRFLRSRLQPDRKLSPAYVLRILSDAGVEIARSLGGVPVDLRGRVYFRDSEAAASSLLDLAREYALAREKDDRLRQQDCRRAVRHVKDRLKLHLRHRELSDEQRAEKQELLEWFLVWLETPGLFPQWLELRRAASARRATGPQG